MITEKRPGRFRKYFLYAIGEIALVMIGILLALQVNNWNEAGKARQQEIKIYREILSDLKVTLQEVNHDMQYHQSVLERTQHLIDHITEKKPFTDSLIFDFIGTQSDLQVYPKTSGYEALNSLGLNLLSNDSVRIKITDLYQLSLKRLVEIGYRETPSDDLRALVGPYLQEHIQMDTDKDNRRIMDYIIDSVEVYGPEFADYDSFINDRELLRMLNYSVLRRAAKIRVHHTTARSVDQTIASIQNELKRIE
ncbi:MAG: DUF6090 family protein [Robiginitalea sp.]|jgi:hypothetical protein